MKQRVITAIFMGIIFIPFFFLGGWFATIFFSVLAYIGTYELLSMYHTKNLIPKVCKYVLPLFAVMVVLFGSISETYDIAYLLLVELAFLLIMPIFNKNIKAKDVMFFIFAIIYSGLSFLLILKVRNIETLYSDQVKVQVFPNFDIYFTGLILFAFVLITTMLTDIGAYQIGVKFGKHKLCPTISPKKSIEGSIAGTIIGALSGTLFMSILNLTLKEPYQSAIKLFKIENNYLYALAVFGIALLLSIAGQLGDLIASKIKREYDIKDYGKIFPGHGGVLDRFDSSIYSFLIFVIILMIMGVNI